MILLALIAVGLLSLSTVTLRANQAGSAQDRARANARMALNLAIADLQNFAGPDNRATAPSHVLGPEADVRHVTGVWQSIQRNPENVSRNDFNGNYQNDAFLSWVMSHPDEEAKRNPSLSTSSLPTVPLVAQGSLGTAGITQDRVSVPKVALVNGDTGEVDGNYAFVALDEGVKARINQGYLPYDNAAGAASANLGTSQRPNLANTTAFAGSRPESFDLASDANASELGRVVSLKNAELAVNTLAGNPQDIRAGFHDFSVASESVLSNNSDGGLKMDLSALFAPEELPNGLASTSIYESFFNIEDNPSAPLWGQFHGYSRIYQENLTGSPSQPAVEMTTPGGWRAGQKVDNNLGGDVGFSHEALLQQPNDTLLLPTVAKVQVFFSLAARDIYRYGEGSTPTSTGRVQLHSPWGNRYRQSDFDYLLHLVITPVITLHNPYNVTLNCENLRAEFINVPMALRVFRDGVAQMSDLVPVGQMYTRVERGESSAQKRFGMTLGAAPDFKIQLQPGEAKVFSPAIPPSHTWQAEISAGGQFFFDPRSHFGGAVDTANFGSIEGWTGPGIGFDLDWFCPLGWREFNSDTGSNGQNINRQGCILLKPNQEIHVEYAPLGDETLNKKFSIALYDDAQNVAGGSSTSSEDPLAIYEFDYQTPERLQTEIFDEDVVMRYPEQAGQGLLPREIFDHASTPLGDYDNVGTFACFTATTKTSFGDENGVNDEGRYATKPWLFTNPVSAISQQDFSLDHPSHHSYDLNILTYSDTSEVLEKYLPVDQDTNRSQHTTGFTSFRGIELATHYELPLAPLQSLPSLNSSNPGASGHLPRFDYPIGNSFAHPILDSSDVRRNRGDYEMLDHSYYLNSALFDRSYFSTFADRQTSFLDGVSRDEIVEDFFQGQNRSLDQRLTSYLPKGFSTSEAQDEVTNLGDSLLPWKMAAFQMLSGGFNVNSLSVEAWMAVLSGINPEEANMYRYDSASQSYQVQNLSGANQEAIFSRFRLPNDDEAGSLSAFWQGTSRISQEQLRELAEAIVEEVETRGPFLSMADFLNRELGPASDLKNIKGVLQAAIDRTSINQLNIDAGYSIGLAQLTDYELATPDTLVGDSSAGAPGYLIQSDLVTALGNAATTRSDTFRIRAYGDTQDRSGRVVATAWCEAIVQRIPEYVDSADDPWAIPSGANTAGSAADRMTDGNLPTISSQANENFGRRFIVKSFRWLAPDEV